MMDIKVLGTGCPKCFATVRLLEQYARELGVEVSIQKVTDVIEIVRYGVLQTPGVVIDGKVVHAGGVPRREQVRDWLTAAA